MPESRKPTRSFKALEQLIGHEFSDHAALERALTHSSATNRPGDASHYERLEFLGDRVLGLCIAEMLFSRFPDMREGELSVRLNALVSGNTCTEIADEIGLHQFIRAGGDVKQITAKRMRSVRADVVEALIAAIYLDAGLTAVRKFVERFWRARLEQANAGVPDSKTALQEWTHTQNGATPSYRIQKRTGPDHAPSFVVEVTITGMQSATGSGRSKRAAEQAAAQAILVREGVWVETADGTLKERRA